MLGTRNICKNAALRRLPEARRAERRNSPCESSFISASPASGVIRCLYNWLRRAKNAGG